jgi:hypothetical protein
MNEKRHVYLLIGLMGAVALVVASASEVMAGLHGPAGPKGRGGN